MRCTFTGLESCSAYAERILQQKPVEPDALWRIICRLARCRDFSLYRLTEGHLGWGSGYDSAIQSTSLDQELHRLDVAFQAAGENRAVRQAVQRAAVLAAVSAGIATASCRRHGPLPLIRNAVLVRRSLWRRFWTRSLLAGSAASLAIAAPLAGALWWVISAPLVVVGVLATLSAFAAWRLQRQLEGLDVLAKLDGPRT